MFRFQKFAMLAVLLAVVSTLGACSSSRPSFVNAAPADIEIDRFNDRNYGAAKINNGILTNETAADQATEEAWAYQARRNGQPCQPGIEGMLVTHSDGIPEQYGAYSGAGTVCVRLGSGTFTPLHGLTYAARVYDYYDPDIVIVKVVTTDLVLREIAVSTKKYNTMRKLDLLSVRDECLAGFAKRYVTLAGTITPRKPTGDKTFACLYVVGSQEPG